MPHLVDPPLASPSGRRTLLFAAAFAAGSSIVTVGLAGMAALLPPLALLAWALPPRPNSLHQNRGVLIRPLLMLILPLGLGLASASVHLQLDGVPHLLTVWRQHGFEEGCTPVELRGRLWDVETRPEGRAVLLLRVEAYRLPGSLPLEGSPRHPLGVRLSVPLPEGNRSSPWHPGDLLVATARLRTPRSFRNPGAFDYGTYLRARGVRLTGTIKSPRLVRLLRRRSPAGIGFFPHLRHIAVRHLQRSAGADAREAAAFLAALLVGERNDLSVELEETLQRSGVYHIIALSGLNVGLIAILVNSLLKLLPLGAPARRLCLIFGVGLYWGVARDSGSITRAALMAALYLAGALLQRRISPAGSIALASVLLLSTNPWWVADAGFQLTFAATLGIMAMASRAGPRPRRAGTPGTGGVRSSIRTSLRVSWGALLATAPITAFHFHVMTPAALLANLSAVPIAGLLLLLALIIATTQPLLPEAAHQLCFLAQLLVDLLGFTSRLAALPPAAFFHVLPPPALLVVLSVTLALVAGSLGSGSGRRIALVLALSSLVWIAWPHGTPDHDGRLAVAVLDVGQGDAILVRFPTGTSMLVDAGAVFGPRFDVGARVVAPALRSMGLLRIDILAITHAHRDHLGGASAIMKQFRPGALWLGGMPTEDWMVRRIEALAEALAIPVVYPRRGCRLVIGGTRLEVLNPKGGEGRSLEAANRDSLVLRLISGERAALLTGDLDRGAEADLLREGRDLEADLLKVGHHGSRTSTSAPFLRRVAPDTAVISVGASNPWGQPHRRVLQALARAGVTVLRTDRDGAVRFSTDGLRRWEATLLTGRGGLRRSGEDPGRDRESRGGR